MEFDRIKEIMVLSEGKRETFFFLHFVVLIPWPALSQAPVVASVLSGIPEFSSSGLFLSQEAEMESQP